MGDVPVIFGLVMELATALGVSQINQMDGCWEYWWGIGWHVAVNGHKEVVYTADGPVVPAYPAAIYRHEWPVCMVNQAGGLCFGISEADIESALREEIERVKGYYPGMADVPQ